MTWDKGAGTFNWGDGGNWSNDQVPTAGDDVTFVGATPSSSALSLGGATRSVRSLAFDANPGVSKFQAGTLNIVGASGSGFAVDLRSTWSPTIEVPVTFGDAATSGGTSVFQLNSLGDTVDGVSFRAGISKANAGQVVHLQKVGPGGIRFDATSTSTIAHDDTIISGGFVTMFTYPAGSYSFGAGALRLEGGTFQVAASSPGETSLSNAIRVNAAGGGLAAQGYPNATVRFTGALTLGGELTLGRLVNDVDLSGPVTISDASAAITMASSFARTARVSGSIVEDVPGRGLTLRNGRGNYSDLILAGQGNAWTGGTVVEGAAPTGLVSTSRTGTGFIDVAVGSTLGSGGVTVNAGGRLRLHSTQSVAGAGNVLVEGGGLVQLADLPLAEGLSEVSTSSTGGLALTGEPVGLDLSASGHASLFAAAGTNLSITSGWVPHGDIYRLGGGGASAATLTIAGANVLTGATRALVHGGAGNEGYTTITRPQDFGGGTTLAGGTLAVTDPGALGTGAITVTGGTLVAGAPAVVDPSRVSLRGGTLSVTDPDAVNVGAATVALAGAALELNTAKATGTTAFHVNASLTGDATVRVNSSASNAVASLGDVSLGARRLTLQRSSGSFSPAGLSVTGDVTYGLGATLDVRIDPLVSNRNVGVAVTGRVTGAGPLTVTGGGTLGLFNPQNQLGGLTINGGTVLVESVAALGGSAGPLTLNAGTLSVRPTASGEVGNPVLLGPGGGTLDVAAGGTTRITGTSGLTGGVGARTLTFTGSGNGHFEGSLSDFGLPTGLTKSGTGTWSVGGSGTYSGLTNVVGGTLAIVSRDALGQSYVNLWDNVTLDLQVPVVRVESLGGNGVVMTTLAGGATLELGSGYVSGGVIRDGAGALAVTKVGRSSLYLNRSQSYSGPTMVRGGSLSLTSQSVLANTSAVSVAGGKIYASTYGSSQTSWINPDAHVPLTLGDADFGGGVLSLAGRAGALVVQPFGALTLGAGSNTILAPDGYYDPVLVTFASGFGASPIDRSPGSMLSVYTWSGPARGGGVRFENPPALVNGILGGWAVTDRTYGLDWATLDANGNVVPYTGTKSADNPNDVSANGWVAGNNVLATTYLLPPATGPRTVNTLVLGGFLDLGGHSLTLDAGGLQAINSAPTITNGDLRVGAATPDLSVFARVPLVLRARLDLGAKPLSVSGVVELRNTGNRYGDLYVNQNEGGYTARVESHAQGALSSAGTVHLLGGELMLATEDQAYPALALVVGGEGGTITAKDVRAQFAGPVRLNGDLAIAPHGLGHSTVQLSGTVSGSEGLSFQPGSNVGDVMRLELLGANTFTGGVTAGDSYHGTAALVLGHDTALGTGRLVVSHPLMLEGLNGPRSLANAVELRDHLSIAGAEPIELAGTVMMAGERVVNVSIASPLTVSGPIWQMSGDPASLTKGGPGVLTLAGVNSYKGATIVSEGRLRVRGVVATSTGVTVRAGAVFEAAAPQTIRQLTVEQGGVAIVTAGPRSAVTLGGLSLADGASLDLKDGAVVVEQDPTVPSRLVTLRQYIVSGRGGGRWGGSAGIRSSAAAAEPALAIGYARASSLLGDAGGQFLGQPVDAAAVLIRTTFAGDATLDGSVDFNDLVRVAQNYNSTVSTTTDDWWYSGDFTYDGVVDFNDLVALAQNYNASLSEPLAVGSPTFQTDLAAAFASVPEPSTLGTLLCVAGILVGRRAQR